MTIDDINKLIQEHGLFHGAMALGVVMDAGHLEHFANLVAAIEREECAKVVEQAGIDGYGTLAAAVLVRERGKL